MNGPKTECWAKNNSDPIVIKKITSGRSHSFFFFFNIKISCLNSSTNQYILSKNSWELHSSDGHQQEVCSWTDNKSLPKINFKMIEVGLKTKKYTMPRVNGANIMPNIELNLIQMLSGTRKQLGRKRPPRNNGINNKLNWALRVGSTVNWKMSTSRNTARSKANIRSSWIERFAWLTQATTPSSVTAESTLFPNCHAR